MGQFLGFVAIDASIKATIMTKNSSGVPVDATAGPTYRVYGPTGIMANGTGSMSAKDSGTVTGATNASPIVITSANHGLTTGMRVTVASVGGNTAANSDWTITRVDSNTFSLDSSTGNGAYTSGGTWHAAGLYAFNFTPTAANGFAAGVNYYVVVNATISSNVGDVYNFLVT